MSAWCKKPNSQLNNGNLKFYGKEKKVKTFSVYLFILICYPSLRIFANITTHYNFDNRDSLCLVFISLWMRSGLETGVIELS